MRVATITIHLIVIGIIQLAIACDVKESSDLESLRLKYIKHSDIIFHGEVLSVDTISGSYEMRIFEMFKGNYSGMIISGNSSSHHSISPTDSCEWIVYADFIEPGIIEIHENSPSRSDIKPWAIINCYEIPPPLPEGSVLTDEIRNQYIELEKKAVQDWENELVVLRNQ